MKWNGEVGVVAVVGIAVGTCKDNFTVEKHDLDSGQMITVA